MEDLMTDVLVEPHLFVFQELEIALPYLMRAYFVSEIRRLNTFAVFMETLLFTLYHFLRTKDSESTAFLLVFETCVLLIAYVFEDMQLVACVLIATMLCLWQVQCFDQRYIHPRTILLKCFIFYVFKYALGAPEEFLCILCILTILYDYLYNFQPKSMEDGFLMLVMFYMLLALGYMYLTSSKGIEYIFGIMYFYVAVIGWVSVKFQSIERWSRTTTDTTSQIR